ncbi:hypothetical protein niasHT_001683 [Heterodera trifolii]|uniref:CLAVATA3/ESR-like protein n=1 Tax=Heterodera trifolii TaxID=157864 RepID=A0ABD2M4B7_9BILA
MSNITKTLLMLILLVAISFRFSASTNGKKNANDGNGSNGSVGIGTKIKRIVTAGLLFTSLATGGAGAIQRSNVQGANVMGQMNPMPPPPPPKLTPLEKAEAIINEHAKHIYASNDLDVRVSPGGPDPRHHLNYLDSVPHGGSDYRVPPGRPDPNHHAP